jgi:hypothetical protein
MARTELWHHGTRPEKAQQRDRLERYGHGTGTAPSRLADGHASRGPDSRGLWNCRDSPSVRGDERLAVE